MTTSIELRGATQEVQQTAAKLEDNDAGRIAGFIQKVADMRAMAAHRQVVEAQRYYDTLVNEIGQLRDHYSDMKTYTAEGAAVGAVAGAWLFGIGAVAGGLAGGALGYFAAKQRKKEMLDLLDHLRVDLGHRP